MILDQDTQIINETNKYVGQLSVQILAELGFKSIGSPLGDILWINNNYSDFYILQHKQHNSYRKNTNTFEFEYNGNGYSTYSLNTVDQLYILIEQAKNKQL